jgi:hypothetical protein
MTRQIQIRRGDAAANDNFTGAIGEVTMDTTNNTLRVHDGQTVGGTILAKQDEIPDLSPYDYVIEWRTPTSANNYTWYRKYKSGWVEQGGIVQGSKDINFGASGDLGEITLPVEMLNTGYFAVSACTGYLSLGNITKKKNSVKFHFLPYQTNRTLTSICWEVKGRYI